jgi:DNA (cytosine-5)-methyltransferase 1
MPPGLVSEIVVKPPRAVRVADLFCGAGGSSTGAQKALAKLGLMMDLCAVNHWPVAIETHSRNHPAAQHYCMDIEVAKPEELVPEGRLDLLMASPTCTFHSRARGGRPINDQQRMDPWHVVRWCTTLRVKRLIVENVPEFVDWGPVDLRSGRPIKRRRGEYFRAWLAALEGCGFRIEWRILNAADFGDATTRERFFLLGRSDGRRLCWPEPTHSRDGIDLLGQAVRKWRAAREIIDWSIAGKSIFDRKRPLSPKTLARIYAGAVKFRWPQPFLVILRNHMDAQSIDGPIPALCASGNHVYLAEPFTLSNSSNGAARSVEEPLPTITTGGASNEKRPGCARPAVIEPFILNRHGDRPGKARASAVDEPIPTATTSGAGYVVEPFILSQASGGAPRSTDAPVPAIPTGGAHALIAPYYGSGSGETCKSVDQPLDTVTTKPRFGLVMPVTHSADSGNRARSLDDPLPTVTTAKRGELAFITAAFGERDGQLPRVHSIDDPIPTLCAQGRIPLAEGVVAERQYDIRFRMLEPHELARAMGFHDGETAYEFCGTKTDITRQIGNAVAVNLAAALVDSIMR